MSLTRKIFVLLLYVLVFTSVPKSQILPTLIEDDSLNQSTNITLTEPENPYKLNFRKDLILLGGGVLMTGTGLWLMSEIDPFTNEEIMNLDPNTINSFDRNTIRPYRDLQAGDFYLASSFVLPFALLIDDDIREDWNDIAIMWAQVITIELGFNTLAKGFSQRPRPYAYDELTPVNVIKSKDAKGSFYSGHTGTVAANTFFAAKVISDYLDDELLEIFVWSAAAIYPALTARARWDSGRHFPTDVITGYLIGASIGYLIPELHKISDENNISVYGLSDGVNTFAGFTLRF